MESDENRSINPPKHIAKLERFFESKLVLTSFVGFATVLSEFNRNLHEHSLDSFPAYGWHLFSQKIIRFRNFKVSIILRR
jgi:hypothetical protein